MKTFTDYSLRLNTEIVFGKGKEAMVGELVKKYGGSKVMFVYDDAVVKKIGLYDSVVASLNEAGIPFVEFTGVQPNPHRSHVQKGIEIAVAEGVDFVLGVGGGSTIDTAKAIAFAVKFEGNWWDLFSKRTPARARLGIGAINTIAASGSETSTSIIIVDDVEVIGKKTSGGGPLARPDFAIMDPELTFSVPKYQTACGATDIFAHTLERYFYTGDCTLGDEFAEGLLRTVLKYGPIAYNEPTNYEARAELMLCAPFAHNDITAIGHSGGMFGGVHMMESSISGICNTTHGAGIGVLMPAWLKYVADQTDEGCARVAKLAIQVFGVSPDLYDLKGVAYEGIERLKIWLKRMNMPLTLTELGVDESKIEAFVNGARFDKDGLYAGRFSKMTREQMTEFFHSVL